MMITAREYVILVYPARAAAVDMTIMFFLRSSVISLSINSKCVRALTYIWPSAQPMIIPGRKSPAGTLTP